MKYFPKSKKGKIALLLISAIIIFAIHFAMPRSGEKVNYGITFSKDFALYLGLDWKETYLALLDDIGVKRLRLPSYWTEIEMERGIYTFENLDWQVEEASKRDAKIIMTLGQKQPRWPECHIPDWAKKLNKQERQNELIKVMAKVVNRYKENKNIIGWQIENEPFLPYGECPKLDESFLDEEITLVRFLDKNRPIIISDSGELGTWYNAAKRADVLGTTLYRIVWNEHIGYIHYPVDSIFYRIKAAIIMLATNVEKIIIIELQTEPWGPKMIVDTPLEEQYRSMSVEQFRENIEYVKRVEFSEAYFWGGEWWYWLKVKKGDDRIWNEAKKVFKESESEK